MAAELKAKVTADTSQFNNAMASLGVSSGAAAAIAITAITAVAAATFELGRRSLQAAGDMETLELRMKQFTGSAQSAKEAMKELIEFAARTPFLQEDVVNASITLRALTENALGSIESMRGMANAALKAGVPLQEMARNVGRLYGQLKRGEPVGEVVRRLSELGVISGDTGAQLKRMAIAGGGADKAWQILEDDFAKSGDSLKEFSETFNGLKSTIKGLSSLIFAEIGKEGLDTMKEGLTEFIKLLETLRQSGELQKIGQQFKTLISTINEEINLENFRALLKILSLILWNVQNSIRGLVLMKKLLGLTGDKDKVAVQQAAPSQTGNIINEIFGKEIRNYLAGIKEGTDATGRSLDSDFNPKKGVK